MPAPCRPRPLPAATPAARALALAALVLLAPGLARALPRVVVDPGHGGVQEGAVGEGLREKDVALQVALKLREALAGSAEVVLTREGDQDVPLPRRVQQANAKGADVFVSLHANSMPTRRMRAQTHGVETYFLSASASGEDARRTATAENGGGEGGAAAVRAGARRAGDGTLSFILADLERQGTHADASRLAYAVHGRLVRASGAHDRGVQQAPFFVLTGVDAPAILVELGYISHPQEGARLGQARYQAQLAGAIAEGVKAFLAEVAAREAKAAPARGAPAAGGASHASAAP
jgi:N-acetylmuramoyl-L-alanine amidase